MVGFWVIFHGFPYTSLSILELYNQKKIKLFFNFKKEIKTGCWKFLFKINP